MKHMKKLASFLLAMVMALALALPAFADETTETGSITINDAVVGQTYTIYQILDLESYNATSNAYSYKAASDWSGFINDSGIKGTYVNVDAQGYVTWIDKADAAAFAKAAQKYAKDNSIDPSKPAVTAGSTTVKFDGLDLGYYLVDTTLGTLCSLDTTNPNVTMEEKNEVPPTPDKTVKEDSTGNYGVKNDADIGQTVEFKATVTIKAGAENYDYYDVMSEGLTYGSVSKVTLTKKGETTETDVASFNYTVSTGREFTDNTGAKKTSTFDVAFAQSYIETLSADDVLTIYYTATVNEKAVVAGDGNRNDGYLVYGDEGKTTTTPPDTTTTYTWDVDVFKYTTKTAGEGDNAKTEEVGLAGAVFTLSKNSDGSSPITLISGGNNVYRVAKTGETGTVTDITTDATGKFTIKGLDSDTYYLTEKTAPAGYNKLAGPVTITISDTGVVNSTTEAPAGVDEVKVLNQSGTELPTTGGIGTTIFYVVGSILVLAAVVLLITKKRMSEDK